MKDWTKEEKYSSYKNEEELRPIFDEVSKSSYRQHFHIQPVTGLLNDPNGFIYHDGVWHLFYQWFPLGAIHGLKHWYHVTSTDLIHWKNEGLAIRPGVDMDNKGAYSGSAFYYDKTVNASDTAPDGIYLFYTGNHRDEDWTRRPNVCVAKLCADNEDINGNISINIEGDGVDTVSGLKWLPQEGHIRKLATPIITPNPDYTHDQRDPKIYYNEELKKYFIILGARTKDDRGCVIVYESEHLLYGWEFAGELRCTGFESLGKMWECPTLERISGRDVLLFCPQHIKLEGRGETTNNCGYIIGTMDWSSLTFTPDGSFHVLDFGFDFYAIACAASRSSEDNAMVIAWMGLPDSTYYTDEEQWSGCLTLPRVMTIHNRRLYTRPIDLRGLRGSEVLHLVGNQISEDSDSEQAKDSKQSLDSKQTLDSEAMCGVLEKISEIDLAMSGEDAEIKLFTDETGKGGICLNYYSSTGELVLDRSGLLVKINAEHGYIRSHKLSSPLKDIKIFIDASSVELFINDGEESYTSRVFPKKGEIGFSIKGASELRMWKLNDGVIDSFIV